MLLYGAAVDGSEPVQIKLHKSLRLILKVTGEVLGFMVKIEFLPIIT